MDMDYWKRWLLELFAGKSNNGFGVQADEFAPGQVKIKFPYGGKPTDAQLEKLVEKAQGMGWKDLYVFKKDGKTPDFETAMRINQILAKKGITDMNACVDPKIYQKVGGIEDLERVQRAAHPTSSFSYHTID